MMKGSTMTGSRRPHCEICTREASKLNCPACARAAVYPSRLAQAHFVLERVSQHRQGCAIIDVSTPPANVKAEEEVVVYESRKTTRHNDLQHQTLATRERVDLILKEASNLRHRMEQLKDLARTKRVALEQRHETIKSMQAALSAQREASLDVVRKAIKRAASKHTSIQADIVSARADLCKEAANLAGLQQRHYKPTTSTSGELFILGGSPVFDLRELHSITPHQFTNTMTNIARLLALSCHYLHIRLPAQLVLPHRNHALPAVYSPLSSYDGRVHSAPTGSASARGTSDANTAPRARPLWTDRKISALSKEDPNNYSRVVEAASLLAWDIAWLCRVHGISVADKDWTDIAAVGRNLWLLLHLGADQRARQVGRNASGVASARALSNATQGEAQPYSSYLKTSSFGTFSHGTAFNFLESAAFSKPPGTDVSAAGWLFSHPSRVSDHLKAYLQAEMSGLEWEILDEGEVYKAEASKADTTYEMVNNRGHTKRTRAPPDTTAGGTERSSGTASQEATLSDRDQSKTGGSGWTKLKSRSGV